MANPTDSPLVAAIAEARAARLDTLALIDDVSQATLDHRAAEGRWSPGEVADHLILTDATYAEEIDALVEHARAGRRFLYRGASRFFPIPKMIQPVVAIVELPFAALNALAPAAFRRFLFAARWLKIPAPPAFVPGERRPKDELIADLRSYLDRLDHLADEDLGDVAPERLRYLNPAFGLTNFPGVLSLLARHERRHQEQLREALAAAPS